MTHKKFRTTWAVTLVLGASLLAPLSASAQPAAQTDDAFTRAADYSAAHDGLAVLVMQHGNILFERYDNGFSADQGNPIQSGTKSFWGPVVAAMIEDGLIRSFDEPVADTITEWQGNRRYEQITIRHLLNLTSGLAEDGLRGLTPSQPDLYAYAITRSVRFRAGQRFAYGPVHYYVLGEVLARKLEPTGQDPLDYLTARLLDPLGITYTNWTYDEAGNPHLPHGAYITARDWAAWGQFLLDGGKAPDGSVLIAEDLLAECLAPSAVNPGYGLTFWLNQPGGYSLGLPHQPVEGAGGGGFIYPDGYPDLYMAAGAGNNRLYVIPSLDLIIVRFSQLPTDRSYEDAEFLRLVLAGIENAV